MPKFNLNNRDGLSKETIKKIMKGEIGLLLILLILCLVFSVTTDSFSNANNLLNVTRQISIVLIISIGMLCVLLSGEIDLSVGSAAALAGVACANVIKQTDSIFLGILAALLIGVAVGIANGSLTVYGRIPSFIVTLAMMGILRGIALVWTQGKAVSGLPKPFAFLGAGYVWVIPASTVLCIIFLIVAYFIIHKTKHGVYLKATGANTEAAILSAIAINKYKIAAFVAAGVFSAVGGIITTSKLLSAQAVAADGMEMDVLSAVILGGASLSGGVGTITGTALGALIIGVINNGMNLLNISSFYQKIVKGVIILLAVLIRRKDKK